jgi:dihydrofolate synthase/folylpolyglutamate synthase
LYGNRGNTVIYGALEGKDHHHMTQLLLPLFDRIIISRPGTFKKSDPEGLYRLMQKEVAGLREAPELYLILDPIEALKLALSRTEEDHAILCTGSFYLGGELVRAYAALNEEHEEVAVCP